MKQIVEETRDKLASGEIDKPVVKDTLLIPHNGYAIIRARMYNPGDCLIGKNSF